MTEDALYRRLVGQLCVELQEVLPGSGLKDLAEFLVDLADEHEDEDGFVEALVECDTDFSLELAQRIHSTIVAIRPPDASRASGLRLRPSETTPQSSNPATHSVDVAETFALPTRSSANATESLLSAEAFLQRVLGPSASVVPQEPPARDAEPSGKQLATTGRKRSRGRERDAPERRSRNDSSRSSSRGRHHRDWASRSPRRKRRVSPKARHSRSGRHRGDGRGSGGERRAREGRSGRTGRRSRSGSRRRDRHRSRGRRRSRSVTDSQSSCSGSSHSKWKQSHSRSHRSSSSPVVRSRPAVVTQPDGQKVLQRLQAADVPNSIPTQNMSAAELWEAAQLKAAGHVATTDSSAENGSAAEKWRDDLNVNVVMEYRTPKFLLGLVAETGRPPSPVRITRNPDGSLQRAAMQHAERMRERRAQERRMGAEPEPEEHSAVVVPRSRPGISSQPLQQQRQALPIHQLRSALMNAVQEHQVLVVIGETGSGKTTQLTQYLLEEGYAPKGFRIGCTQPRRVAAITVARRVAQEVGCQLGTTVGYAVRFEDCTSPATKIKYMTDGLLLRETLADRELSLYSAIILDEAHERALNTDVLFGLLKDLTTRRPDLRLIVTSATLDAEKFSAYFRHCPIFTIPGRTFPVELLYSRQPEVDFVEGAVSATLQVHANEAGKGDILVFLTGQDEIEVACQQLRSQWRAYGQRGETAGLPDIFILPIYSAMPPELQARIFEPAPSNTRKIIVATNIAETSVTIDGVGFVIDSGFVKQKVYDPRLGMESLAVTPVSKAAAKQRAGRAGRTGPGKCYRLYTEAAWAAEMVPDTVPELCRANLGHVVLTLKAMGISDLLQFDFLDPPAPQGLIEAMATLHGLGALDDEGALTPIGRRMAELPLEPMLARTLLAACDLGCTAEVLTITAMLSVGNIFFRPKAKQLEADTCKAQFAHPDGDHLTYLGVFRRWERANFASSWCFSNFVNFRALSQAREVRGQLADLLRRFHLPLDSTAGDAVLIQRAICSGYFLHVARRAKDGYATLSRANTVVYLHPSSLFFNSPEAPAWLVYHELVLTSREYMRDVVAVNPRWLPEVAPGYFSIRG